MVKAAAAITGDRITSPSAANPISKPLFNTRDEFLPGSARKLISPSSAVKLPRPQAWVLGPEEDTRENGRHPAMARALSARAPLRTGERTSRREVRDHEENDKGRTRPAARGCSGHRDTALLVEWKRSMPTGNKGSS